MIAFILGAKKRSEKIKMHSLNQFLAETLTHSENLGLGQILLAGIIAYWGGILASLTPCVYPMIPITISVIGGMGAQKKHWSEVFLRGLTYILGMTVVYSFLGVLAGISGKVFGSFTSTSGWYLTLGFVLTVAALLMLEVFTFDPQVLWEKFKAQFTSHKIKPVHHQPPEMGFGGAFALGASSGLIAAPCTTPVLTAILAFIAQTQSVALGFFLMFTFSLGLGTLLLLIALFTGALKILPRSGQWMKKIKIISGLILLAFAEYLIYRAGNFGGI